MQYSLNCLQCNIFLIIVFSWYVSSKTWQSYTISIIVTTMLGCYDKNLFNVLLIKSFANIHMQHKIFYLLFRMFYYTSRLFQRRAYCWWKPTQLSRWRHAHIHLQYKLCFSSRPFCNQPFCNHPHHVHLWHNNWSKQSCMDLSLAFPLNLLKK